MRFRPTLNWLETRDNPSGPDLLEPTAPTTAPETETATTAEPTAQEENYDEETAAWVDPQATWG